jgi:hypothetical protein
MTWLIKNEFDQSTSVTKRNTPLSAKVGTSFADRRRPLCRPGPTRVVEPGIIIIITSVTNVELPDEDGKVIPRGSTESVELDGLQKDTVYQS